MEAPEGGALPYEREPCEGYSSATLPQDLMPIQPRATVESRPNPRPVVPPAKGSSMVVLFHVFSLIFSNDRQAHCRTHALLPDAL